MAFTEGKKQNGHSDKVQGITQVTQNRHLNFFTLDALDRNGQHFPYYMASRARDSRELWMNQPDKGPDGVTIVALYGKEQEKMVLVRQFRYALKDYVYECPAGLVEQGEDLHQAAIREVREETGLQLNVLPVASWLEKPFFMTDGMTDEACSYVFGYCEGTPDTGGLEDTEELQIVLADRREARRILREEQVALSCALMLMRFVTEEKPLAFLEELGGT